MRFCEVCDVQILEVWSEYLQVEMFVLVGEWRYFDGIGIGCGIGLQFRGD